MNKLGATAIVVASLLLLAAMGGVSSSAKNAALSFRAIPPDPQMVPIIGNAWTIFANGPIDLFAGERLKRLLAAKNIPADSHIYLDSPGGNLVGGIELGRVIREWRLRTNVGVYSPRSRSNGSTVSGVCFSACALAYLGGYFRFLSDGARLGFHRFAFPRSAADSSDIAQVAQITSAVVVEYIRSMDVDVSLFKLATSAGPTEMFEPPRHQLRSLNVVNDGRTGATWTLESSGDGLYAKGEQDTAHGINKFMVLCANNSRRVLYIVFDPQGRENEVMQMPFDTLMIDGREHPLQQQRIRREVHNGWINAFYRLSDAHAALLAAADRVGVIMRFGPDAPVFFGFDSMPVGDGRPKLLGLLSACRR